MFVIGLGLVVVLLACANVTNLLLASASSRRQEIGTRAALGASRGRIVRQLLTESLVLAVLAGSGGLIASWWLAPVLASLFFQTDMVDVAPDLRVLGVAAALTGMAGLIAGLAPARYGRIGVVTSSTGRVHQHTGRAPARLRATLLAAQAAVSIVLVAAAVLLGRGLLQAATMELGLDPDRLLNVNVEFPRSTDARRADAYWRQAIDRVRQLPGVSEAGLALGAPFAGGFAPLRTTSGVPAYINHTSAAYFRTLGIRLLRGRFYTDAEMRSSAAVAVISESLARDFWGSENPLGDTLQRVWGPDVPGGAARPGYTRRPPGTQVVGVVADAITVLERQDRRRVYLPLHPRDFSSATLVVDASNPMAAAGAVAEALRALDADVVVRAQLASAGLQEALDQPRTLVTFGSILGGTAWSLALIGLFGVTAFAAAQRRHEASVRMSLGARPAQVVRLIMRDSLRPAAVGLAIGLVLALLLGRVLESNLYGISGRDPIALVTALVLLVVTVSAAAFLPARRAAHANPSDALKDA